METMPSNLVTATRILVPKAMPARIQDSQSDPA